MSCDFRNLIKFCKILSIQYEKQVLAYLFVYFLIRQNIFRDSCGRQNGRAHVNDNCQTSFVMTIKKTPQIVACIAK